MKFFLKVFFTTMLIAATFFSIGTFYLIFSSFQDALEREVSAAYKDDETMVYTINGEIQSVLKKNTVEIHSKELFVEQWIKNNADDMVMNISKQAHPFRMSNHENQILYQEKWDSTGQSLNGRVPDGSRGYEVVMVEGQYFVHAGASFKIQNETIFIESKRNVTPLFEIRAQQLRLCMTLMVLMLILGTGIVMLISSWLTKPIIQLSKATKQFAEGDFSKRVNIQSQDEVGMLSADFNAMAEQLELKVHELKQAAERQERFVSSFAHELKTPLTSIIGYADLLRSKIMPPEQALLSANYIFEEGRRLEALSMKLMELIILRNHTFVFKRIQAGDFLNSVAQIVQPLLDRENIVLKVTLEPAVIEIEPDLLKTVCLNLIDNARKSITENGRIVLEGRLDGTGYIITVSDNGCGMAESELSRITEAFYTVDKSRARLQGGAGLGLSISAEIIELHGARLAFESQFGEGTRVQITLKGGGAPCQN